METAKLKKFAQKARRELIEQVSARLGQVLAEDSLARRQQPDAVSKLQDEIEAHGEHEVIERAAYTWFNRFCALRFMDANHYNRIGVVSPAEGQTQPEILAEAKSGHVDENMVPDSVRKRVLALLAGEETSRDPQGQAYRLLLVSVCNQWHQAMPFLFERIADYTELLMPDDLLSESAILGPMREALTVESCQDVEVIGWLYQFYISEKKEQVFAALKTGKKITPENIPAATQLFTPHWIVRYLVENSLGRLWMLSRPNSRLVEQMDYYIKLEESETDFLKIGSPEEIRICDSACGSGHMLTYAFDLLYAIYEEEGYVASEIPGNILTHNLYGIEIDQRAGALAAFALTMKARATQRRFFSRGIQPNICVLENIQFDDEELKNYMDFVGRDLFTARLGTTLRQFEEAENFGSLIRPEVTDVVDLVGTLDSKNVSGQLFLGITHQKVRQALRQADYLSPKYHIVVANPPYKKKTDLNVNLQDWLQTNFVDGKYDLYQAFIIRNTKLAIRRGYVAMITMQGWMFAPRYEAIRANILTNCSIISMAQLGERAFDSIGGDVVSTTAFVLSNNRNPNLKGQFIRLTHKKDENAKNLALLSSVQSTTSDIRFAASDDDFLKIPGQPLVFWASKQFKLAFQNHPAISEYIVTREGLTTGNNDLFLREWHEVSQNKVGYGIVNEASARESRKRWFPYVKGGGSRRWYGNLEHFVNWFDDGVELKKYKDDKTGRVRSHNYNGIYAFRPGLTWSGISGNDFAVRDVPGGFMFDAKGPMGFVSGPVPTRVIEAFLNSKVSSSFLRMLAPTLDFKLTHVLSLPLVQVESSGVAERSTKSVSLAKCDWDSYENSWDFTGLPLLNFDYRQSSLKTTYQKLRAHWREMTLEMQRLEEENNRIFIEAYGLQHELVPEVPLNEITLTCNPQDRYGEGKGEDELEGLLLADTVRDFISYAVGCMLGRYSLDKPGLILANQGETIEDYLRHVPEPSFEPDGDNVIPTLDAAWFTDGIVERFCEFLKVTFGTEHYEENLDFIESALRKNIRKFFLNDFYKDHVRRYKKRPIYWLFSSPKGSFNALIYIHRYRSDTVSVILNDYLREFRTKLEVRLANLEEVEASTDANKRDKTAAVKEINKIRNTLDELEDWERKVLLPLAEKKIEIDLDDGVKANYPKFGDALKKIPGLSA